MPEHVVIDLKLQELSRGSQSVHEIITVSIVSTLSVAERPEEAFSIDVELSTSVLAIKELITEHGTYRVCCAGLRV